MSDKLILNWYNARKIACSIGGIENLGKLADAEAALAKYAGELLVKKEQDKPAFTIICQYGNVVQHGCKPGSSLKVDGIYWPEPNFVTKNAYYTINGARYEGIYDKTKHNLKEQR